MLKQKLTHIHLKCWKTKIKLLGKIHKLRYLEKCVSERITYRKRKHDRSAFESDALIRAARSKTAADQLPRCVRATKRSSLNYVWIKLQYWSNVTRVAIEHNIFEQFFSFFKLITVFPSNNSRKLSQCGLVVDFLLCKQQVKPCLTNRIQKFDKSGYVP